VNRKEKQLDFIEMRAKGNSFDTIAKKLRCGEDEWKDILDREKE